MIIVDNLTKKYGTHTAVSHLSFTVPDGQVTGFLGPNGSGKSTTMRCILGLDKPTAGAATFHGAYYDGPFAELERKPKVAGAIIDTSWFHPARSGRNHLKVIARGAGISDNRVEECLAIVGMTDAGDKKLGGYSLGMKQRIGVAAALLGNPQHLILDEPINGLDPAGVNWMRTTIRRFAEEGRAVLVSSHLLAEMEQTADRIVVIGKGHMVGEYSMSEFLSGGTTVHVESPQAEQLAAALTTANLAPVSGSLPNTIIVPLNPKVTEAQLRHQIAQIACDSGCLVTRLQPVHDNLEQRYLAATAQWQEFRAGSSAANQQKSTREGGLA
ncbi:ABC-type multidrug transport system, ATPase component [Corynebacterium mustelae]|uniref:ABC-type multidrug transport system, ATPase component n=1 Tax=Corynebacterium mustelae TaxID=571915 RepID=A0A0G3GW62_9CORY|nr:ABC transporter ATP-binding protein [Corynebacterium mustelae]AKK04750.1 ABC-type multidrug transport system, ATPase component [Corynebacterium mustelae]